MKICQTRISKEIRQEADRRPHYYCFEDTSTGIYWMIPLSSRIDKYRRIMEKKEKAGKSSDADE